LPHFNHYINWEKLKDGAYYLNRIPKIIHYCWFGGNPISELGEKCIASWKKYCPEYEIIRWDESNFDISCNQYVKEAYEAKRWAFVTDYIRLHVVYNNGGIYLDTDVELLKSFDDLLGYSGFMGFENERNINTGLGFGAVKNNNIIYEIMNDYKKIPFIKEDGRFDLTPCPQRNTKILARKGLKLNNTRQIIEDVVFLPTIYLSPKDFESGKIIVTEKTFSIHHFNASWHTEQQKEIHEKGVLYRSLFGKKIGGFLINLVFVIKEYGFLEILDKIIKKIKSCRVKS